MADLNLQEIHDLLVDVAHEAGRMMLAATPSYLSSGTKKNCSFLSLLPHQSSQLTSPQPQIS
jgi:myo-inositol-1(or 4)-monophosphatase